MNSKSAPVASSSAHVAMKFGSVVRYDNVPETGRKKNDRVVTSELQFNR